jgi:large subunit ribosomal protein L23
MATSPADVLIRPLVTEKSTVLGEQRKYAFEVHPSANKHEVGRAVEAMFHVEVERVNVMNVKGKPRRFGRFQGMRPDWRKAVVTLREGHSIDIFPGT